MKKLMAKLDSISDSIGPEERDQIKQMVDELHIEAER